MHDYTRKTLFIDGQWMTPSAADVIDVVDPATEKVIGCVPNGTVADVDAAVAAARRAFDPLITRAERSDRLARVIAAMEKRLPDIADLCVDLDVLQRRRDVLVPALDEQDYEPTHPEGTFYVIARSPVPDDVAFVAELAAQRLFVLPGSTVSLPGWFRISLTGSDPMIEAAIDLLREARRAAHR